MNSELMNKFLGLWQQSETGYDGLALGVRFLSYDEIKSLCDRIAEKWQSFTVVSQSGVHAILWHQEDDRIFIRRQGRYYGKPLVPYHAVSIIEFPLDLVKKAVVLGYLPD